MPGKVEEELTAALETWREAASLAWLSPDLQDFHGGAAVLSDKVLNNIVRYAANGKIKSIEDLRRETQWSCANKYGAEVLDLIKDLLPYHFRDDPPPPPPPPPLGDSAGSLNHAGASVVGYFRCREAFCMIFDDLSRLQRRSCNKLHSPCLLCNLCSVFDTQAQLGPPGTQEFANATVSKRVKKGSNKCSLCGSVDHISESGTVLCTYIIDLTTPESKRCPYYSEYAANKENNAVGKFSLQRLVLHV